MIKNQKPAISGDDLLAYHAGSLEDNVTASQAAQLASAAGSDFATVGAGETGMAAGPAGQGHSQTATLVMNGDGTSNPSASDADTTTGDDGQLVLDGNAADKPGDGSDEAAPVIDSSMSAGSEHHTPRVAICTMRLRPLLPDGAASDHSTAAVNADHAVHTGDMAHADGASNDSFDFVISIDDGIDFVGTAVDRLFAQGDADGGGADQASGGDVADGFTLTDATDAFNLQLEKYLKVGSGDMVVA